MINTVQLCINIIVTMLSFAYCIMLISVSFIDVIYNIIKTKRLTEKYNLAGALRCLPRFLYHHIRRICWKSYQTWKSPISIGQRRPCWIDMRWVIRGYYCLSHFVLNSYISNTDNKTQTSQQDLRWLPVTMLMKQSYAYGFVFFRSC